MPMTVPTRVAKGSSGVAAVGAAYNQILAGFSVAETADSPAAAEVVLRHGSVSGDEIVPPMNLAADGFGFFWMGEKGIQCPNGIYVDRVSGTTTVVLYTHRQ
jgi:hypothetical protein